MPDSNDAQFYYDLLRAFFDSANDAIFVLCDEMKFLICNKTMQSWLGRSEEGLTEHKQRTPITELLGESGDVLQFTSAFSRALNGESAQFETFISPPDGDRRWIELDMKRVDIEVGDMIIAVARDISERKLAEEESVRMQRELAQSQKIQALGELTGGIAHDFNNILSIITGYAELSISEHDANQGEISLKNIENIRIAAERARSLISQLMVFSRNGENKPVNLFVEANLNETVDLLQATLPSNIELCFEKKNNQAQIQIDPVRLQQLILNLCINSRDAIIDKGYITISVDQVSDVLDECRCCFKKVPGSWVSISIEDNGIGMDESVQSKIFEPFFTTKNVGDGTGLGLSMVKRIMEDCNGHILLNTEPNAGTVLSLLFPPSNHRLLDMNQDISAEGQPEVTHNSTVMVVDDENLIAEMLSEILNMNGYSCMSYTSSVEALESYKVSSEDIDVVITDQTMPLMTGTELIEKMLAVKPGQKIILTTGYSDLVNPDLANELGVSFVHKPVKPSDLLLLIQDLLK